MSRKARVSRKEPNYIAELHEIKYQVPTGRLVCDCCYAAKGQPHTRFCYWNPINTKKDDAAIRAERREGRGK